MFFLLAQNVPSTRSWVTVVTPGKGQWANRNFTKLNLISRKEVKNKNQSMALTRLRMAAGAAAWARRILLLGVTQAKTKFIKLRKRSVKLTKQPLDLPVVSQKPEGRRAAESQLKMNSKSCPTSPCQAPHRRNDTMRSRLRQNQAEWTLNLRQSRTIKRWMIEMTSWTSLLSSRSRSRTPTQNSSSNGSNGWKTKYSP